jgi:hypothetical protein
MQDHVETTVSGYAVKLTRVTPTLWTGDVHDEARGWQADLEYDARTQAIAVLKCAPFGLSEAWLRKTAASIGQEISRPEPAEAMPLAR